MERPDASVEATSEESSIQVSCYVEDDDGGDGGLSNKTVIVLLIGKPFH